MGLSVVNEGSFAYLTFSFKNAQGNKVSPNSITWQLHDVASGTILSAEQALTPGLDMTIYLSGGVNTIQNEDLSVETHVLTLKAVFTGSAYYNDQYLFNVRNMLKL